MTKANLLWIDLEMTGLDPAVDKIVEVGAIATDFNFTKVAEYEAAVKVDADFMRRRMVGEFWEKNAATRDALITASSADTAKELSVVESELMQFIQDNLDTVSPIYLAGNSIHQDRKFIERAWPKLNQMLSYRMLDVSAWKIIFEHYGVKFTKPEHHRATSDIIGSIEELKYYLKRVKLPKSKDDIASTESKTGKD